MVNLNQSILRDLAVPVSPPREQKRIADKIDALLARVDACRERLDRIPAILKRFRQSVLAAATTGELTREWREERADDGKTGAWTSTMLEALCDGSRIITYGVIKLGDETDRGVPCLRTSNVRWLRIDTGGMKRIAPALSADYARTVLRGGEVLVNVRGTLGGVAVAASDMTGWNVSREVAVVPADNSKVDSTFLSLWIGAEGSQRWLAKVERGVAYTGINIEDLRTLPVSVPPMDEQREIVRRVQILLADADAIESRRVAAAAFAARLAPSVLAKAFRGELVPQDPNDEPASELLARIRNGTGTPGDAPIPKRGKATRSTRSRAKEEIGGLQ
jgi:type I restriction enzyme S subunit